MGNALRNPSLISNVGKVIEVDIALKRADAPGAAGYMLALLSLLG